MGALLYQFVLMLHIVAVLTLIGANAVEYAFSAMATRADTLREASGLKLLPKLVERINIPSVAIIFFSGLYLSVPLVFNGLPYGWIVASVFMFIATVVYMSTNGGKVEKIIEHEFDVEGNTITPELKLAAKHMQGSTVVGVTMIFGLVVLMIYQPSWIASLAVVLATFTAGVVEHRLLVPSAAPASPLLER